jgi:hypothetical protein
MEIRLDRVGLLLDQLATSVEMSRDRFTGLTDEEYLWEPAAPSWSLRPRDRVRTSRSLGAGEWQLEDERDPDPPPVTTIAWRLSHLLDMYAGRWEWTFGARRTDPTRIVEFSPSARVTLDRLWEQTDRWMKDVTTLTDEQLDVPGYGQYPRGLDPQLPFVGILWWMNREFIHHAAEVALLRDLYQHRSR